MSRIDDIIETLGDEDDFVETNVDINGDIDAEGDLEKSDEEVSESEIEEELEIEDVEDVDFDEEEEKQAELSDDDKDDEETMIDIVDLESRKPPKQKRKKIEVKFCKSNKKTDKRNDNLMLEIDEKKIVKDCISLLKTKSFSLETSKEFVNLLIKDAKFRLNKNIQSRFGKITFLNNRSQPEFKKIFAGLFYNFYGKIITVEKQLAKGCNVGIEGKNELKSDITRGDGSFADISRVVEIDTKSDAFGNEVFKDIDLNGSKDVLRIKEEISNHVMNFDSFFYTKERKIIENEIKQFAIEIEVVDGIYTCKKCGGSKVLKYSLQTAGGDEGTSIFIKCVGTLKTKETVNGTIVNKEEVCNSNWKIGKNG